jgi:hypothetical protein
MATVIVKQDFEKSDTFIFTATISGDGKSTEHKITVDRSYFEQLADGKLSMQKLVEESMHFLLNHEDQDAILRSFNLREIGHYFPEYEEEMKKLEG